MRPTVDTESSIVIRFLPGVSESASKFYVKCFDLRNMVLDSPKRQALPSCLIRGVANDKPEGKQGRGQVHFKER